MPEQTTQPTAQHHSNLLTFLQILLHLAPAISAPFLKNARTQEIVQTESGIVQTLVDALAASKQNSE